MRPHFTAGLIGFLAAAVPSTYAVMHKPAPTIVRPQTTIMARNDAGLSKAEARQAQAQWGDLDQKEVDALSDQLKAIPKLPLTIFCDDDTRCGDMQLDFDNAFETAHWDTKLEKPLFDDTVGIATTSPALQAAINDATSGRLNVAIKPKNGTRDFLVIGKKK